MTETQRGRGVRRWILILAPVLVIAGFVVLVLAADGKDDGEPTPTSSSTSHATTTVVPDVTSAAVWPFASSGVRYHDPVDAARGFATQFAGFQDPVLGAFRAGDARSGEVEVRPSADGPVTTVSVRQLTSAGDWWVLGSATASVQITEPKALDAVSSPVRLQGTSTAFEANVNTEIRQDGSRDALGSGFVMGGSNGDMGPFDGTLSFRQPTAKAGALLLRTLSAKDGSVWEAAIVRVRFAEGAVGTCAEPADAVPGDGERVVKVFYSCRDSIDPPVALARAVPETTGVLRAAVGALLEGPTARERDAGFVSWFSSKTAGLLMGVNISADGDATVDFGDLRPVIPNASASAGSQMLLSQLDATVFQFRTVRSVVYRIDGDCQAFTDWLQIGGCDRRTR